MTQFGEGEMDGSSWEQALDVAGFRKLLSGSVDLSRVRLHESGEICHVRRKWIGVIVRKNVKAIKADIVSLAKGPMFRHVI